MVSIFARYFCMMRNVYLINGVNYSCNELAIRCIDQFIFNVCCVRPLTTMGRKKLVSDCSHLEMALKPFVNGLGQLGTPYK